MFSTISIVAVISVYLLCITLHLLLPGHDAVGYCCDNSTLQPLQYKLNGVYCLVLMIIVFYSVHDYYKILLYENYYSCLFVANAVGLTCSSILLLIGGKEKYLRCVTTDQLSNPSKIAIDDGKVKPNVLVKFFLGCSWNPRFIGVDLKMLLYLIGAITLQMIILSGAQVQINSSSEHQVSNAMLTYVVCFSWFLFEYMMGERVHLYTYDLFAEKVGFKLTWGCLVFYPFFYPIGIHSIINSSKGRDITVSCAVAVVCLFLVGWVITRGANMQKYYFRIKPQQSTFLFVKQVTVKDTHILCSGWWGVSRHFNYFGEIVQAIALSVPGVMVGSSLYWKFLPPLYPLYYVVLFVTRQIDDDAVCKQKYGAKWDEYCRIVPYRIVPGVW